MFSLTRALVAGALLAASASAGDHFILSQVRSLSYSRVDPMVSAGKNGPHVHHILGGSAFGPNTGTPDSLEQSQCSSSLVGDDKSAYWSPLLYYKHANGTYSPMTGQTRIYYFMKPGNGTIPVKAFPRGHRMLAGPPSDQRPAEYPPKGVLSYDQRQAMDPRVNAIMWGCGAGSAGGSMDGQSPWLPNHAPNGCGVVNAGIFYPSCSDGRLDSDDHFSHMRYPLDGSNGFNCPSSHPIKYPTMFLEHFYFPTDDQPYRGANQDNWVLSNGDTTGLTMHADFINAWNPGVLEATMDQCNTPNAPEENLSACAPLAKTLSVDNANKCRSQGDIVDEDVGLQGPISALPGCNPIWPIDARSKPSCKASDLPMGQPDGRVEFPALALALPVANGSSAKTIANPSSSTPATTSTTAAATTTSSVAATTTSSSSSAAATTSSVESASTSTTASSDPYEYGAPAGSSTSVSASGSSTAASSTSTGSADPYEYGAPAGTSSSSASAAAVTSDASTSTASSDPYAYGAPAAGSSSSTSVSASASVAHVAAVSGSSSAVPTSSVSSDPYAYGAPAGGSSSSTAAAASTSAAPSSDPYEYGAPVPVAGSGSSTSATASAAAAAVTTSASYVAPGSAPGAPSASYVAQGTTTAHVAPAAASSPVSNSVPMNPPASSASSSYNAAPTPQKANAAPKPKKTCAHRKHKNHGTGHNRRQLRKRLIK